ncbi:hypothetical protein TNCV_4766911 [Trichonephila clavipes]|nr:hypothetical protein TNCV_4766911 [Trichonephila clavipes]
MEGINALSAPPQHCLALIDDRQWRNGEHLGQLQIQVWGPQVGFYKGSVLGSSQALSPPRILSPRVLGVYVALLMTDALIPCVYLYRRTARTSIDGHINYDTEARKDKILKDFTKTELITVCTILGLNCAGSAKELSEHIFKNLSDLASLKNNFTEQLTDDEDEDSAPFSLESTNDANKQPLTPPIYHLPSPQDVFVPLPQTQRNQSQRGNEENVFLLKELFQL